MRPFVFAVCLAATLASTTEAKETVTPFKALTGSFFAVSVSNLAESVRWYSENLGLSVSFQQSSGGFDVAVVEGGGLVVELVRDPSAQPPATRPGAQHGVFKAGFLVKDFDKTVEQLRARGVPIAFGPFPERDRQRANLILQDNAGNLIQILGD